MRIDNGGVLDKVSCRYALSYSLLTAIYFIFFAITALQVMLQLYRYSLKENKKIVNSFRASATKRVSLESDSNIEKVLVERKMKMYEDLANQQLNIILANMKKDSHTFTQNSSMY